MLNGPGKNEYCPISPEDFYEHFKRLSDLDIQTSDIPKVDCDEPSYDSGALDDSFTELEIMEVILKLKSGKAAGTDRVLNEYIKNTASIFIPSYIGLFNRIFDSANFSEEWALGLIVPIFKRKGDITVIIIEASCF